MKIKKIYLKNFKGIADLEIDLDSKTTIFFGVNGVGKSSLLRAIDLLYAQIISEVAKIKKLANIEYDEIKFGKTRALIKADFEFEDSECKSYHRWISRAEGRKYNGVALRELAEHFRALYIEDDYEDEDGNWITVDDRKNMPIFVNYGVHRLVLDVPLRVSKKITFKKINAFDKAIESKIDFRTLFRWFREQEDMELEEKVRNDAGYVNKSLAAVKTAMLAMLDGFTDIRIERNPLAMKVCKEGMNLTINQLSDGEKCTIALFGDLARRMAMANPSLENPLEGTGVVLIDEIELHMHPSWQRKVINVLKKTFPNIQFIITTHSPQVLGELDEQNKVIVLERVDNTIKKQEIKSLVGWDSNVILEELMNTASTNQDIMRRMSEAYELISNKKYSEAEKILNEIDEITSGRAQGVTRARMIIAKGKRNEENQ